MVGARSGNILSNSGRFKKLRLIGAVALAALFAVPATAAASHAATSTSCPWVTSTAPIAQRVAQLMSQMTLADKITMVEGHGTSQPVRVLHPRDPVAVHPGGGPGRRPGRASPTGMTGVTQLPAGVSLAATWDPSLAQQYGQVIGAEEYGKGASANLGPTVNIDRDPRWGRSFEALYRGPVPERLPRRPRDRRRAEPGRGVPGQALRRLQPGDVPQHARPTTSSSSNRALQEIYMPSFYAAVTQANAASVMCAYSMVNGNFGCNNSYLRQHRAARPVGLPRLRDVRLRRAALHAGRAARAPTRSSRSIRISARRCRPTVQNGTIPVSALNTMVTGVLTEMFRFNLFSQPRDGLALGHGDHARAPGAVAPRSRRPGPRC